MNLYGREAERSTIATLLDGARAGHSGVLVLRGEAGVGKSALLADAAHRAGDMQVLRVHGVESESEFAFAALHQLLHPALAHLDDLPPHQAKALRVALGLSQGEGEDRFAVALAALGVLSEAAEHSPVLCLVDDAHWLDDASMTVLSFLARRLKAERVVMLVGVRDDTGAATPGMHGLPELPLAGLSHDAAAALLTQSVSSAITPGVSDWLIACTAGNPLALLELPSALSADQLCGVDRLPARLPLTRHVEQVFADRAGRLPPPTRTVLLVAAAEPSGRSATILAAAAALGVGDDALDAAERADLVRLRAGGLEFSHPLIRVAVYQAATDSERRRTHRALAGVLQAVGDADGCTWHRAAAAVDPDEDVASALDQTAARARGRGGHEAACTALERAAELSPDPRARCGRLLAAARSAWLAGQFTRTSALLHRARPDAHSALLRADIGQLRGWLELSVGSAAAAQPILLEAARDAAQVDTERARRILAAGAEAAWLSADRDAGTQLGRIAAGLGPAENPRDRLLADVITGFLRYLDGDATGAARLLAGTIEVASDSDEPDRLIMAAHHASYLGNDDAAYELNARVVARARAAGAVADVLFALPRLAQAELVGGRWTAAAASAAEAVRLARETGRAELGALPLAWLTLLAAWRGDQDGFDARVEEIAEITTGHSLGIVHNAVHDILGWARAVQLIAMSRPASALSVLEQLDHPLITSMAALDRIESAVHADRRQEALGWLEQMRASGGPAGPPWLLARAAHCHGLLSQGHVAERRFDEALAHHQRARRPFERARTQLSYGEHLRRARRRVDARAHLAAALDAFEHLGAAPWAERARVELRASGRTMRTRDPSTLLQLTPQEIQVARFVARGLSTREVAAQLFLSPRTIDFHLRNVFAKLGISSRSELARLRLE